jgi:ATPase subunit of ABC transporter with duplicated ATPase domains
MRIKHLIIHESETSKVGIKAINIDRLGPVVAFIGRNGSGKSRILRMLEEQFKTKFEIEDILKENIIHLPNIFKEEVNRLDEIKEGFSLFLLQAKLRQLVNQHPTDKEIKKEFDKIRVKYRTFYTDT